MLVKEDGVAVRIHEGEAGGAAGTFIRLADQLQAFLLQFALKLAHICEAIQLFGVLVPAGIEGEDVLLEHVLEEADDVIAILHDEPVVLDLPAEFLETELLVKITGFGDILHRQID